jgi:hypothetical protein
MKTKLFILAAAILGAFSSAQVLAHHSFAAEFDGDNPIRVSGTILKVDWTNPHAYLHVEVETETGEYEEWALEMGSPNGLMRRGWTRNSLPVGTDVTVRGTRARDGSYKGNVQFIVLTETCERLFAGTSQREFDENAASQVNRSEGECVLE